MCSRCNSFRASRSALASSTFSYSPAYRNIGLSLNAYSPLLFCTTHFSYTAIYSHCGRSLITHCSVSPRGFLPELVHAKDSPPLAPPENLCLLHLQRGLCVMGYSSFYETSNICPEIVGKGARKPQSRAALQGDLRDAPLPDTARQRPRQLAAQDSRESRVRLPDGSQRHPRLQREGLGCAHRWLLDSEARACRLRRELGRAAAGDAPPLAERVRV